MKKWILMWVISLPLIVMAQDKSWFSDVTSNMGLDQVPGFKTYVADLNGDFYPDLITISGADYFNNELGLHLFINEYDTIFGNENQRRFVERTNNSGLHSNYNNKVGRRTTAIAIADVDNDGDNDIVAAIYYHRIESSVDNGDRAVVLLNDGNAHFTIKEQSGFESLDRLNTQGVTFLDFNKDGNIDVFLGNWSIDHTNNIFQPDVLMMGLGDGSFQNFSDPSGIGEATAEPLYGSSAGDWNNDGFTDIFTAPYCRTPGRLWQNNGDSTFSDVSTQANYNAQFMPGDNGQPLCMWGAYPGDFDNDGDFDFYFALVHGGLNSNEGRSTIVENLGAEQGFKLQWRVELLNRTPPSPGHQADYEAVWVDANQDGLLDLLVGQGSYPNNVGRFYLFLQDIDHSFTDVTLDLGFAFDPFRPANRVRVIDFDLDGDEDFLVSVGSANRLMLLENKIADDFNHLAMIIDAPKGCNRNAIGANIKLYSNQGVQMREVHAGQGNAAGQNGFYQIFGLGNSTTVDSVIITLPNQENEKLKIINPEINKTIRVNQEMFIQYLGESESFTIYPNPVLSNEINMHLPSHWEDQSITISVFNSMGQKISSQTSISTSKMTLSHFSPLNLNGVYYISLTNNRGERITTKFLIAR